MQVTTYFVLYTRLTDTIQQLLAYMNRYCLGTSYSVRRVGNPRLEALG